MRRRTVIGAVLLVLAAAACAGDDDGPDRTAEVRPADLLYVQHQGGISTVDPVSGEREARALGAVPAGDWSALFRAAPSAGRTRLVRVEPGTGAEAVVAELRGRLDVRAVSHDGSAVILLAARESGTVGGPYRPEGRLRTRVVVVRVADGSSVDLDVAGNVEPEAFALDADDAFVVEYIPPDAPDHYRVRKLDLRTADLEAVHSPDGNLQEAMQGDARTQAASADGRRLYTFYTLTDGIRERAFVHVLDLAEEWAHCIDLPPSYALPDATLALALSPGGEALEVVDRAAGVATTVDTDALRAGPVTDIARRDGAAVAASDGRGTLFVASNREVQALAPATREPVHTWVLDTPVTSLLAAAGRLYAGQGDGVAVLDPVSGRRLAGIDAGAVEAVSRPGAPPPPLATVPEGDAQKCAC